ncbi:MAG: thiamine-phosphate kinase [Thermoplasmata archaeon]
MRSPPAIAIHEASFHRWLQRHLPAGRSGLLPLGDDAAAIPLGHGRALVLTTDALVEGTHFRAGSPPRLVGRAAAAVSLSDAGAKAARPIAVLLDILAPRGSREAWARSVAQGAEEMAAQFGCHLVGGDTKPSSRRAVVSTVAALGRTLALAPRTGARAGDLVVTTGTVGRGGWAAMKLAREPSPTARTLRLLLSVQPRVREGGILGPYVHGMLDTSDGLAEAAHLLAGASGVRVILEWERLPLAPQWRRPRTTQAELHRWVFFGGDYELFATLDARRLARVQRLLQRTSTPLSVVGRVERGAGAWLSEGGKTKPLAHAGWKPFG